MVTWPIIMVVTKFSHFPRQVMFLRQKNFSEAVETLKSFEKQDNKVEVYIPVKTWSWNQDLKSIQDKFKESGKV